VCQIDYVTTEKFSSVRFEKYKTTRISYPGVKTVKLNFWQHGAITKNSIPAPLLKRTYMGYICISSYFFFVLFFESYTPNAQAVVSREFLGCIFILFFVFCFSLPPPFYYLYDKLDSERLSCILCTDSRQLYTLYTGWLFCRELGNNNKIILENMRNFPILFLSFKRLNAHQITFLYYDIIYLKCGFL